MIRVQKAKVRMFGKRGKRISKDARDQKKNQQIHDGEKILWSLGRK